MCMCLNVCVCVSEHACVRGRLCGWVVLGVHLCIYACVCGCGWVGGWVGGIGCASVHVCVGRGCNREAEDVGMCVLVEKGMDGGDRDG